MSRKPHAADPRRLDIAAAARDGARLEGAWPLAGFERLAEGRAHSDGVVAWSAQAGLRAVRGAPAEPVLHLSARAQVVRVCQRCLAPVTLALAVERDFRFVPGEDRAAELDAEDEEEDVLEMTRSLDLHELVEDELLLALPIVPRHEACPQPLAAAAAPDEAEPDARPNPFAALAALRRGERH